MKRKRKGDWMLTYTGRQFWPMDVRPGDIDIHDIARGLSMICRFGGHVTRFYSVAEHSCHVFDLCGTAVALLHDAPEAYIGDMVRPLKRQTPEFMEHEARIWWVIVKKFKLPPQIPDEVKDADNVMLMTERRDLQSFNRYSWGFGLESIRPVDIRVECWEPLRAEYEFLQRYTSL